MIDPWSNRVNNMVCESCIFFAVKEMYVNEDDCPCEASKPDERGLVGRCRRHSPTMNGYPVVFELDWCGDHKLDENKI